MYAAVKFVCFQQQTEIFDRFVKHNLRGSYRSILDWIGRDGVKASTADAAHCEEDGNILPK